MEQKTKKVLYIMARKCYIPKVGGWSPDSCLCAEINKKGSVICKLGSIIWKIKNKKLGWHCDWEKPNN